MATEQDAANDQQETYLNEFQVEITAQAEDLMTASQPPKETERVKNGAAPNQDQRILDVISGKPCKICYKVLIPVEQFPKFNFVGKILGPKGNSLKRLQESTGTRMAVLGRGSMRDKAKEDQMRLEGGKYEHLNEPLHVWIEAYAQPADALRRMAHAVSEVKKYLNPEYNDDIRQQQLEELMAMGEVPSLSMRGRGAPSSMPGGGGHAPGMPPPSAGGLPPMPRMAPVRGMGPARGMGPRGGGMARGGGGPHVPSGMATRGAMASRASYPQRGGAMVAQPTLRPAVPHGNGAASAGYGERYDYSSGAQDYSAGFADGYGGTTYSSPVSMPAASSTPVRPVRDASAYAGGTGDGAEGYGYDSYAGGASGYGKAPTPARGRGDFRTRPY